MHFLDLGIWILCAGCKTGVMPGEISSAHEGPGGPAWDAARDAMDAWVEEETMGVQDTFAGLTAKDHTAKLELDELACALYEGTPHVQNLAEKLARTHGQADALTFYGMMGEDVMNFWRGIALQLIEHSRHWRPNSGSACVLGDQERERLAALPRVG